MGQAADLVCSKLEDKKAPLRDIEEDGHRPVALGTKLLERMVSFNQHGVNRHMIRENYVPKTFCNVNKKRKAQNKSNVVLKFAWAIALSSSRRCNVSRRPPLHTPG